MHFFNDHRKIKKFINFFQKKKESVIQDILIPIQKTEQFWHFLNNIIKIKPVWICPIHPYLSKQQYDFCKLNPETLYLDFGFWDAIPSIHDEGYYNRKIEKLTEDLEGHKGLYSSCYYSEEEFWHIYNSEKYKEIKQKYEVNNILENLYTKCTKKM